MTQIVLNENDKDVHYENFPDAVITQYLSKEGEVLGLPQKLEFPTLAAFLLWAMSTSHSFTVGSSESYEFCYFVATRPPNQPLMLETQYVRRVYTFA